MREMMMNKHSVVKKAVSLLLFITLIFCNMDSFIRAEDSEESTGSFFEGNTLNGWHAEVLWANGTREFHMHSDKTETVDAKIVVNYYAPLSAITKDYGIGTVKFSIPDIGGVKREGTAFKAITANSGSDAMWSCEYDVLTQSYVFTNKKVIEADKPLSGGFEIMWKLSSRDCSSGYSIDFNPIFSIENDSTVMSEMEFTCDTERDYYYLQIESAYLTYNEYLANQNKHIGDDDYVNHYVTYNYTTRFNRMIRARASELNTYFVKVFFADEDAVTDEQMEKIIVQYADEEGDQEFYLTQIEDPYSAANEMVWGFYRFVDKESGALEDDTFKLSYPDELVGKTVNLQSFLKVHYLDEEENVWHTYESTVQGEKLDGEGRTGINIYKFEYENGNFSMGKGCQYESGNMNYPATNEGSAPAIANKLLAKNIYNNTSVTFVLAGRYRLSTNVSAPYHVTGNNKKMYTAQGRQSASESGDIGGSDVNLETKFDMVLGDDRLTVLLNDNTFRMLESDEYTMKQLVYPADNYGYDYEVYISTVGYISENDAVAKKTDYYKCGEGNTKKQEIFDFSSVPGGVKAVYVKIKNIKNNDYYTKYRLNIEFNIDEQSELAKDERYRINTTEGRITNIGFMRAYKADTDTEVFSVGEESFVGAFTEKFKQLDRDAYGKLLYHSMSSVYLRDIITLISSNTTLTSTERNKEDGGGYQISIDSKGTIKADDGTLGSLAKFSVYVKIPELLDIDEFLDEVTLKDCSAYDIQGNYIDTSIFSNNVTYRIFRLENGEKVVTADFDFSLDPLEISSLTSVSINIPSVLSYTNYKSSSQNTYRVDTYVMIQDGGISKIVAASNSSNRQYADTDRYDLNSNRITSEVVAGSYHTVSYSKTVSEWNNIAEKFVKSYRDETWQYTYENGQYVSQTTVNAKGEHFSEEANKRAEYSYRLSVDLGPSSREIYFCDVLERSLNDSAAALEGVDASKRWYGTLKSIDVTYAKNQLHLNPIIYYSTTDDTYVESGTSSDFTSNLNQYFVQADYSGNVWEIPEGIDVKSFVIYFDTSGLTQDSVSNVQLYCIANLEAPEIDDENDVRLGGYAINNYDVHFTSGTIENRENLKSANAKVKLLAPVILLTMQKVDSSTGAFLRDATFSFFTDPDCMNPATDWTGATTAQNVKVNRLGELVIDTLRPGTYYYKEITSPLGYKLEDVKPEGGWPCVVLNDTDLSYKDDSHINLDYLSNEFVIKNDRLTGTIVFTKKDADDGTVRGLQGAVYQLYHSDGTMVKTDAENDYLNPDRVLPEGTTVKTEFTTDESGKITITGLPWGSYYLTEITPPAGYELNTNIVNVNINKNVNIAEQNEKKMILVYPKQEDSELTASIKLTKYDEDNLKGLANAWFSLEKKNDGEWNTVSGYEYLKTASNGTLTVQDLKFGVYRFKEIVAPTGYVLDTNDLYSEEIVLNSSTVGTTQTVRKGNKRIKGSATLQKTSDDGIPLNGAKFDLYKVEGEIDPSGVIMENGTVKDAAYGGAWSGDAKDLPMKLQMTTTVADGQGGMLETITNLDWGRYYFKEVYSPSGYEMDDKIWYFEITAENAAIINDNTKPVNNRKKGEIVLNKVSAENITIDGKTYAAGDPIKNAEFVLYTSDSNPVFVKQGTKTVGAEEVSCYSVCDPGETGATLVMVSGEDGKIRIDGIQWGGYYLEEVKAPNGFAIADKVRFTVNAMNCLSVQELECEDRKMECLIRIDKKIDTKYEEFGTPSFTFKITSNDHAYDYTSMITLSGSDMEGSTVVRVPAGTYTVKEVNVGRYETTKLEYIKENTTATGLKIGDETIDPESGNLSRDGENVFEFTLRSEGSEPQKAEVKFTNQLKNYNGLGHTGVAANIIPKERKITGFRLELINQYIDCDNASSHSYTISHDMLKGYLTYDDGESTEMTQEQMNDITPVTWTVDNGYSNAGQSQMLSADFRDSSSGKKYKASFLVTVGPYNTVESQKVIFYNDSENISVFYVDGKQISVNTAFYNNNDDGDSKIAVSGSYIEPTVLAGEYLFGKWVIVGANIDGLVGRELSPTESAVTNLLRDEYENGLRELELRAVINGMSVDYDYTGQVETFIAPKDGIYFIEGWGAQGGDSKGSASYPQTDPTKYYDVEGGRGGYSYGYVYLHAGDEIYVAVGGKGNTFYTEYEDVVHGSKIGGFNGGGNSVAPDGYGARYYYIGAGGGATHFALTKKNTGVLSDYASARADVLLVAGGGGGSSLFANFGKTNPGDLKFWHHGNGGAGGGIAGFSNSNNASGDGATGTITVAGGTQESAGKNGSFGVGGTITDQTWGAGGGGGWYGGGASYLQGGGGGSGHVNEASLITGATIGGNETFFAPAGNLETGHAGNGFARITYVKDGQFNLRYSRTVNQFTAPFSGYYKLEGWGAAGGSSMRIDDNYPEVWSGVGVTMNQYNTAYEVEGGRGGYSSGYIYLTANQKIYYAVGEMGKGFYQKDKELFATDSKGNTYGKVIGEVLHSPFNGGGNCVLNDGQGYAHIASGGGATHFALTKDGSGILSSYQNDRGNVLLVAGGGGGSGTYLHLGTQYCYFGRGGSGGGPESQGNYDNYTSRDGYVYSAKGSTLIGSDSSSLAPGSFGQGGSNKTTGGGGGYFGGSTAGGAGAAGGSGYVNTNYLLNTENINGVFYDKVYENRSYSVSTGSYVTSDGLTVTQENIPTYPGAIVDSGVVGADSQDKTMIGNRGNGFARITYIPYTEAVEYGYTGYVQSFTAPVTGKYKLEAWGAQGGSSIDTDVPHSPVPSDSVLENGQYHSVEGGKGGYSYGVISLNQGETIYLAVGGAGEHFEQLNENVTDAKIIVSGGYNGGGVTTFQRVNSGIHRMSLGSGGGATHFATANRGELKNYSVNKDDVLLVAGGGGGSAFSLSGSGGWINQGQGGAGGGLEGLPSIKGANLDGSNNGRTPATGGTQTAGGTGLASGGFGIGAGTTGNDYATGGGGGWYGGGAQRIQGGAGGSGYYKADRLENYGTIAGNQSFKSPNGEDETGHSGNGYARVTYLDS